MRVLDQKYTPLSCRTIMRDHFPKLYRTKKEELCDELSSIEHCCLTTDLWTSRTTAGYVTLTCHYINQNLVLKSRVLCTRNVTEAQTAEALASILRAITDEWAISSKILCVTTDSASNIKKSNKIMWVEQFSMFCPLTELGS